MSSMRLCIPFVYLFGKYLYLLSSVSGVGNNSEHNKGSASLELAVTYAWRLGKVPL